MTLSVREVLGSVYIFSTIQVIVYLRWVVEVDSHHSRNSYSFRHLVDGGRQHSSYVIG